MAEYSRRELTELESALNYVENKKKKMADRIRKVRDMNWFQRLRDSKVSNDDWRFYHFFSLKVSDPNVLEKEIENHKDAYDVFERAINMARNGDEGAEDALEVAFSNLMEIYRNDELKINADNSTELCDLHKNEVANRDKTECSFRRVEGAMTRRELRRTRIDFQQAVREIREQNREIRELRNENTDLIARFERLMTVNEQLIEGQQKLNQENTLIRNLLQEMLNEKRGGN